MNTRSAAAKLLDWYATLTPESLDRIGEYYCADASFRDPFNQVVGIDAIQTIFHHMFENTQSPRFVLDTPLCDGLAAFVTWQFHFGLRGKHLIIEGSSHLEFNDQGKVTFHRDYWDASEELYEKLPLIGSLLRWIKRKIRPVQN